MKHDLGGVTVEKDLVATMRDGVVLKADVYRPDGSGDLPVLLMRVPYGKELAQSNVFRHPAWFARQGYLVVIQDTRGRWSSDGVFSPYRNEVADGYDTVEWAASLPGTTGRVGMYGLSYSGSTQFLAALSQPPHLTAIAPAMTSIDFYKYKTYRGGVFALAFSQTWAGNLAADNAHRAGDFALEGELYAAHFRKAAWQHFGDLPINAHPLLRRDLAQFYYDWLAHPTYDQYWRDVSIEAQIERIQVPCLHIGGWYDMYVDSTVRAFRLLQGHAGTELARANQRLVVGPWSHGPSWTQYVGDTDFGDGARPDVNEQIVRWYDHWLKGKPEMIETPEARVRLFVLGENAWREHAEWPAAQQTPTSFFLHSLGGANSNAGDGALSRETPADEPADHFTYNPRNPVPSFGGNTNVDAGRNPVGPFDHRRVEARNDILVYTSEALERPLEIAGMISARIWFASTAPDTDLTVKLLDVGPEGRAANLADGILRASFRDSFEKPTPIEPGRAYQLEVDLGVANAVIKSGHRIRVEVSSSNFPAYVRHPNALVPVASHDLQDFVSATQVVRHDRQHPSHISLPITGASAR